MAALTWPRDVASLVAHQRELASLPQTPWPPPPGPAGVGGCWVCFPRDHAGPGSAGDPAWAAAVLVGGGRLVDRQVTTGTAGAAYTPGLLALRVGPLLEEAVRALGAAPDVVLLDGTASDHPRRAGLALHLGAELDMPTVGVTHRPLVATGSWPADLRGATSPLRVGTDVAGCWLRVQPGRRPLAVHPGWRVDLATAVALVLGTSPRYRTPEPLRLARQAARAARARAGTMDR